MLEDEEYTAVYWGSRKPRTKVIKPSKRRLISADGLAWAQWWDRALRASTAHGLPVPSSRKDRAASRFLGSVTISWSGCLFLFSALQGGIIQEKNYRAVKWNVGSFVFLLGTLHAKPSLFIVKTKKQGGDLGQFAQKQQLWAIKRGHIVLPYIRNQQDSGVPFSLVVNSYRNVCVWASQQ